MCERPNVILILADDMGAGDLSGLNGGLTRTPNLDRLAGEGVYFEQAYSSAPVCAPARASLLTGRYPHRTGCLTLNMARFPELSRLKRGQITLADVFRSNGYVTGLVGKWHCGMTEGYLPLDRGFDEFEGFAHSTLEIGVRELPDPQSEGDILEDGEVRPECVALEHHSRIPLLGRQSGDIPVSKTDHARIRSLESGDHSKQRRLAAARWSEEEEE